MGKNKQDRGHSVNRAWVHGDVERTEERRLFLIEVPDRTEATLLGIIRTHVLPGSIIMTDCFRSYHNLNEFYTHFTVNHSNTFKDPETGAHTNSRGNLECP
ncbi:putative transposase-like protein [Thelohanellus kitauei]|uniref:Putative transposase-like protein n=1 Tax=Thelohanellus kitauei TaxID=669202 RepID=A0A0C2N3R7_THEKT|nr:putative transposase-like protein [Thelohanellus kitauei]